MQIIHYDQIDSTNAEAWRLVDRGALEGTVVLAQRQTAGRGQWGRTWSSPPGGLYLSIVVQPNLAADLAGQITLWSAWGVATALNDAIATVRLKWPNDLVVDGRKLGGILTETRVDAGTVTHAAIGVGINWLNPVPPTGIALADLPNNLPDLESLAKLVVSGVERAYKLWQQAGIAVILPEYLALLGDRAVVWQGKTGKVVDITATGNLVVGWQHSAETSVFRPGTISLGYSV